jgi:dTDP-4-dehydrorhamnose 3,5-epimerase
VKISPTSIAGVMVVESNPHTDRRGVFARLFCSQALGGILGSRSIVQVNHSLTRAAGAVRGLHYQNAPHAEMKLVRCLKGKVWDLAVDLRVGSPTLLQWHAEELSAENARMLVIPEGCAHGFQVLAENSELLYLHTAPYMPAAEGGLRPTDPKLAIRWPMPVQDLSDRDRGHPLLNDGFSGLAP